MTFKTRRLKFNPDFCLSASERRLGTRLSTYLRFPVYLLKTPCHFTVWYQIVKSLKLIIPRFAFFETRCQRVHHRLLTKIFQPAKRVISLFRTCTPNIRRRKCGLHVVQDVLRSNISTDWLIIRGPNDDLLPFLLSSIRDIKYTGLRHVPFFVFPFRITWLPLDLSVRRSKI